MSAVFVGLIGRRSNGWKCKTEQGGISPFKSSSGEVPLYLRKMLLLMLVYLSYMLVRLKGIAIYSSKAGLSLRSVQIRRAKSRRSRPVT